MMKKQPGPKLSFVATSRNDDLGGDLLQRMNLFIQTLSEQCTRHSLNAELILVEWNPPEENPRLKAALRWPGKNNFLQTRIIEVPAEIHRRFKYCDQVPLFQMMAKNVGIRRANGQFVIATNIDILFANELIAFLEGPLDPKRMYRVDRFDVPMPPAKSVHEELEFCQRNIIRIFEREGTKNLLTGEYRFVYPPLTWKGRFQQRLQDLHLRPVTSYSRLHTNASGDFTLMHKDAWFALRGYPELKSYAMHIDSLLCHAAHHAGIREQVLKDPMRIYHIDHPARSDSADSGQGSEKKNGGLAEDTIHRLTNEELLEFATRMRKQRRPILFNQENWGLMDENLPEEKIG